MDASDAEAAVSDMRQTDVVLHRRNGHQLHAVRIRQTGEERRLAA
jgi:hypothetical protein